MRFLADQALYNFSYGRLLGHSRGYTSVIRRLPRPVCSLGSGSHGGPRRGGYADNGHWHWLAFGAMANASSRQRDVTLGSDVVGPDDAVSHENRAHLWAHTPNHVGQPHLLADHLRTTSQLAARRADAFGCAGLAADIGLVHDLGKAGGCFQDYLRACRDDGDIMARQRYPSRDHKSAGARLLMGHVLGTGALKQRRHEVGGVLVRPPHERHLVVEAAVLVRGDEGVQPLRSKPLAGATGKVAYAKATPSS